VDYSVQARFGESPARYGEILGTDLNQLAVASNSSPWRVSPAQNPARHEYSPATRYGEFMQKLPCFAKIIILQGGHLQSSFKPVR
jgi:phage gp29-like protein